MAVDIFGDENLCVNVYDPNEPDPDKKLIGIYDNPWKASKKLGLTPKNVRYYCVVKKRIYSPFLDKEIALRYSNKKKNNNKKVKSNCFIV